MHKRLFRPKALVMNWHKAREKKALEHMAHERVLWLDAMTHEGERISIIDIYQATARGQDLQRRVNTHIQAEMKKSEGRRRIMGEGLNAATSRTGYSISTKSHFENVDHQFQEFIQRTREDHHQKWKKRHENVEECSPSARPSPAALTASPPASHACRTMRGVQLHLAGCSARRSSWRSRAAIMILRGGHNNKCADWCTSPPPSTWTPASLIQTQKHQHLRPWRLLPLHPRPSRLSALVPSNSHSETRTLRLAL